MERSFENNRNRHYGRGRNQSFDYCFYQNEPAPVEDKGFIPLESSSPMSHNRRFNGQQGRWRHSGSPDGFNNRKTYSYNRQSAPNTPYKYQNKSYQGFKTSPYSPNHSFSHHNRSNPKKKPFNIADYFNPKSIFEDPWKDLLEAHNAKFNIKNGSSLSTSQHSTSGSSTLNDTLEFNCSQELTNSESSSDISGDIEIKKDI